MAVLTDHLAQLPIVLTFVLIISAWVLFAFVIIWLGNRFVPAHVREVNGAGVRNILAVCASFYGFLVGFVVVQEWGNVSDAQSNVSEVASDLAVATYAAGSLPPSVAVDLTSGILRFGRAVTCREIPSLAKATQQDRRTSGALSDLFEVFAHVRPASVESQPAFGQAFGSVGSAAGARRQVINAASERVPFILMIAIVLAGAVLLVAVSLQDVRHGRGHLMAVLAVALFIGLGQSLVVSLSRPFAGAAGVSAAPLRDGVPAQFQRCENPATLTNLNQLK